MVVYGGNDTNNCGDFKVSNISTDGKTASLTGIIQTAVTEGTPMYAYVSNENIKNIEGKFLEVYYSNQDGTFEDAMAHTLACGRHFSFRNISCVALFFLIMWQYSTDNFMKYRILLLASKYEYVFICQR